MHKQNFKNIQELFAEYLSIADYNEKLHFFDTHFGLIPFDFPFFRPGIDILMKGEELNLLIKIFEQERKTSLPLSRKIVYQNEEFVFNISPTNYNAQFLNDYILESFLVTDKGFKDTVEKIRKSGNEHTNKSLKEARTFINLIGLKLKSQDERSFRNQFLTVFYTGFIDYNSKFVKRFTTKKKVIELYLYAQGILFAKYIAELEKGATVSLNDHFTDALPHNYLEPPELEKKLSLLYTSGIIKYLYTQAYSDREISKLFSELLGINRNTIENTIKNWNKKLSLKIE